MPWLLAPHQEGLLFSGKMLLEWGVVVSDASVLLFEDIKKLNAQQRTDVPACFIYAPISNLPMTTKHKLFFFFLFLLLTILFSDQLTLYFSSSWSLTWIGGCVCAFVCGCVCLCVCVCLCMSVCVFLKVCFHQKQASIELSNRCGFCN